MIRKLFGSARGSRGSFVDLMWMEISNVDSLPTVRFDPAGGFIWQKIRPILHCETFVIVPSGQLVTQSIYPKIDAFYLIYLHGTLIGTCGFVPCELKTNPYASARKSCSVLVF